MLHKLEDNGWLLRAKDGQDCMDKLPASSDPAGWLDPFYIRDIFVWLPDVRWGEMPACSTCGLNDDIHVHDYRLDKPTRR